MGAEIKVATPTGEVTYNPCNMDFAITALWARRIASSTGLDPAAVSAPPDAGTPATELPPGGLRVNNKPAVALYPGELKIVHRGRLRTFALIDVDVVPVTMFGTKMAMVGGRGRQIAVISDDAAMATLHAWYDGPPPAPASPPAPA